MIPLSLAEVAEAVGGRLVAADPAIRITGPVEFDSRKVRPGGLFVAFPGERVDGHDYAATALDGRRGRRAWQPRGRPGADGAGRRHVGGDGRRSPERCSTGCPTLTVIGLTGSSGKTSTKDLIAQLATRLGPTVAPPGSFNNELGHPYTALQADSETRFLVLEKGARGPGHVRYLCQVAPPRIAVVINVGVAHIGEFGSVDAIAEAKGELVEGLPADGVAVLNADDPRVRSMAARTAARVVLVGEAADAEVRAVDVTLDERGRPSYTLVTPEGRTAVRLGLSGAAPGGQLAGRGGGGPGTGDAAGPSSARRWPRRGWCQPAGWMSSTVPTG